MEKKCTFCLKIKDYLCFDSRKDSKDGLRNECKECRGKRERRREKKYKKLLAPQYKKKLEIGRKYYYKIGKFIPKAPVNSYKGNEAKYKARLRARRKFPTPEACAVCGGEGAHRHHKDYSKPLEITWVCISCHGKMHRIFSY